MVSGHGPLLTLTMEFDTSTLHLPKYKSNFDHTSEESNKHEDPLSIADELASHMTYLRKLKFRFLEQSAKDKYITAILGDATETPLVTNEINDKLREANKEKKTVLRGAKAKLKDKYNDINLLAPLLEEGMSSTFSMNIMNTNRTLLRLLAGKVTSNASDRSVRSYPRC